MDEPVRRRSFVRLAATDAVQNAGRLAALSGIAAGMVKQGVASLANAVDPAATPEQDLSVGSPVAPAAAAPLLAFTPAGAPTPRRASLDATARATLATSSHLLLAVNRHQVGPFINRYPCAFRDERVWIETRTTSAMAQSIRRDPAVTLLLDEPATSQRLMIFGTARLLEGADAGAAEAAAADAEARSGAEATAPPSAEAAADPAVVDADRALLVIDLSHAVRTPL